MRQIFHILAIFMVVLGAPVFAQSLSDGRHAVFLESVGGDRIHIADIDVKDGAYAVDMASEPFSDHFLSMRPFKCLDGPEKTWCHVPYPYEIARNTSADLTDLEYDFLFLWKGTGEYGIDMWNGVYYQLEPSADGRFVGRLHEMNMDVLSVPPEAGNLRPIREVDLEPGEPDSHWLPVLTIE
ncbi:hypothetical protein [Marivita hallyeonensis]|uniref:Uncharacterized protein n=1 Tax=Marivita hallyeonensis TaxID=996342 RepID=A0A1M5VGA5_9RHOB|nr:hypothetical protein [Marivita hallyeonensis]SHH74322.1 hypothetical protein SAMN05443551_2861 [Marivita hallyeonensis]